jgi:hypothetical protein
VVKNKSTLIFQNISGSSLRKRSIPVTGHCTKLNTPYHQNIKAPSISISMSAKLHFITFRFPTKKSAFFTQQEYTRGEGQGLGYPSRYSNLLLDVRSRDRFPVEERLPVQTSPGANPASYTICIGSRPEVKRLGRGVDNQPPSSAEVYGRAAHLTLAYPYTGTKIRLKN